MPIRAATMRTAQVNTQRSTMNAKMERMIRDIPVSAERKLALISARDFSMSRL